MFDPLTGSLKWPVHTGGYEFVALDPGTEVPRARLDTNFYRQGNIDPAILRKRGIIRAIGEEVVEYLPVERAPGLGRRLASLFKIEEETPANPPNAAIIEFCREFGLPISGRTMLVLDFAEICRHLFLFAAAIDRHDLQRARETFNGAVVPSMTVRLVGNKQGKPTANWKMEVEPTNLIALAWFQLASEMTSGRAMKKCAAPDCLEWFPDRSNKKFCGNRCKMAFHKYRAK